MAEPLPEPGSPLELTTMLVIEELWGGDCVVYPVAGLDLVSCGTEAASLTEQRMFLAEYLSQVSPDTVARYVLPEGTTLREVSVLLPRDDLPHRIEMKTPLAIPCVVIPAGRDAWVVALPLRYTLYVAAGEDLEEAVRQEVRRLVAAEELSPLDYLGFFPSRAQRLDVLSLSIERSERAPPGRGGALRKAIADRHKRRRAVEVLESVATPLHGARPPVQKRPLEGRDAELATLSALLTGAERMSVALVGPELVGKTALFQAWLERAAGEARERLVYQTSGAQLIAGMSGLGQWQERVRRVMEAASDLDALLVFDNLGDLFTERVEGHVDIAGAMKPYLEENRVRLLGELRPEMLEVAESRHGGFLACLSRLRLEPLSAEATARALRGRVAHNARTAPHRPTLAPQAVLPLIDLAERYLPYRAFPGKAMRLYDELCAIYEKERTDAGEPITISPEQLFEVFALSTGIPTFLLRDDRTLRVEDVVSQLQKRVIGQAEAVRRVAEVVCVVKAGLSPTGKPLATFLFIGPTGVGKTELARALAAFLFGSPDRMIRFDMSEYMDGEAASRLIRGTDRAEGLLTRKVREQPFCVLLLDEIEKASSGVFDLLLQVTGEGRLSDARGKTAYFHNAIIILTSNLGAAHKRGSSGFLSDVADDEAYYQKQVSAAFRPEFLNRLDRIIAFRALSEGEALDVSGVALARIRERRGFTDNGVLIDVSKEALARLSRGGYSERYGARALRRHLEDHLVAPAARLLSGLGAEGRDALVTVRAEGEASALPGQRLAGLSQGGLLFAAQRRREGSGSGESRGMEQISTLRRAATGYFHLGRVERVKERIDYLVAQLNYGSHGKKDRRASQEIGELQAEHHRLREVFDRASAAARDIDTLEELAMMALFDGEPLSPFLAEAERADAVLKRTVVHLLLAEEPRRDQITLLLQELDDGRALDLWLGPLLADLERRGWTAECHVDEGKRGEDSSWPASRRWGPPRDTGAMAAELAQNDRSFRSVLLVVRGPYAAALLALEAGVLRYSGVHPDIDKVQLFCDRIAFRASFDDAEWGTEALAPRAPHTLEEIRKSRPTRDFDALAGRLTLPAYRVSFAMRPEEYWGRFEEVALAHLLRFEESDDQDRDELFTGVIDAGARS